MLRSLPHLLLLPAIIGSCTDVSSQSPSAGSAQQEIIGGYQADPNDFPSTVALLLGNGICTGVLVTPEWVLTAAHCIDPTSLGHPDQQSITDELVVVVGASDARTDGTRYEVDKTIPSPFFSIDALGDDDIGLVHLAEPVTDKPPTPINRSAVRPGMVVDKLGYGFTEDGQRGILMALDSRESVPCSLATVSAPEFSLPPSGQRRLCATKRRHTSGCGACVSLRARARTSVPGRRRL